MASSTVILSAVALSLVLPLGWSFVSNPCHISLGRNSACSGWAVPSHGAMYGGISFLSMVARYGPPDSGGTSSKDKDEEVAELERLDQARLKQQEKDFRNLVHLVVDARGNPTHLPRIMTQHMDLLLSMRVGHEGTEVIEKMIQEATSGREDSKEHHDMMEAIDFILSFVEEFVDQTQALDDTNKRLLGKIIKCMKNQDASDEYQDITTLNQQRDKSRLEDELNALLEEEKPNFTAGFLRHLEGECDRIASAPSMTRESTKLLETMRVIQTRVLEEVGKDLGEGAVVLGQLLGYTEKKERLAVLEAGLMVRGVGFAKDLLDLTEEALDGFQKVPGEGADPELVTIVQEIRNRIADFVDKHNVLQ